MHMNYETLEVSIDAAVATVCLNRPDVRNAFNETMIAELTDAFSALGRNAGIRVILLAAKGPAFCAGADLNWMKRMASYTYEENLADASKLAAMLKTIYECSKPVIAKVHGDCYAGGMGLVAACDISFAASTVHFCLSEVKLGLTPATISPYVIRAMGSNASRRYFITAERFTAEDALRIGFIHECIPIEELDIAASAIADAVCRNSPNAVQAAKKLVLDVTGQALSERLICDTVNRIAEIRASEEGRDGVQSFLEKRRPAWLQQ